MRAQPNVWYALGALFVLVGIAFFLQLDSWIAPTIMVIAGVLIVIEAYRRQQRRSRDAGSRSG